MFNVLLVSVVLLVPQQVAGSTAGHGSRFRSQAGQPLGDVVSLLSTDGHSDSSGDVASFLKLKAGSSSFTMLLQILSRFSRMLKEHQGAVNLVGGMSLVSCVLISFVYLKMMRGNINSTSRSTIIVFWLVMSLLMSLLNKECTNLFQCPLSLVMIQMTVSSLVLSSYTSWTGIRAKDLWRWCVLSVVFGLMLCSSMFAFKHSSVTCLLILRNCQPIMLLFIEKLFLADAPAISRYTILSCTSIAIGSALYIHYASSSSVTIEGIHWIVLNCAINVVHRVMERYLLTSDMRMSFEAMNLLYNVVPLLPIAFLVWATGETQKWPQYSYLLASPMAIAIIACSAIVGLCLGQSSIMVATCGSATSINVLTVANKLFIIIGAMVLFSERFTLPSLIGAITSLAGCAAYGMTLGLNTGASQKS